VPLAFQNFTKFHKLEFSCKESNYKDSSHAAKNILDQSPEGGPKKRP